jgi:hypothetical protein
MIDGEFGVSIPGSNTFEVNNSTAIFSGQPGWDTSWANACAIINNGGTGKNYVIKVTGAFTLAGDSTNTFIPDNIKVLIYAPANKTISLSSNGSLLYAGANQTLMLRNITLEGKTGNTGSLVYCGGANAHLIIRPGTVIKGNTASSSSYGGGVYVGTSGTFTMNSGTISGNTVSSSSTTSSSSGGGVYVYSSGTFTMSGGTLSGNTANSGASLALYSIASIAKYGHGYDSIESGLTTADTLIGHN